MKSFQILINLFAHKNEWSIGGIKYDSTNFSHKERERLIKKYALIKNGATTFVTAPDEIF